MQKWTKKQTLIFLLQWTLGTFAVFLLYYLVVTNSLQAMLAPLNQENRVILTAFGLGCSMGLVQWLVLRKGLPKTALWIPATALAWAITFAAMRQITRLLEINVDFLKLYWLRQPPPFLRVVLSVFYGPTYFSELDVLIGLSLILGFLLGLAQFALLKPHFRKAALWIPLNIAASYFAYRLAFSLTVNSIQSFVFFQLHAILTALALLVMLWRNK